MFFHSYFCPSVPGGPAGRCAPVRNLRTFKAWSPTATAIVAYPRDPQQDPSYKHLKGSRAKITEVEDEAEKQ